MCGRTSLAVDIGVLRTRFDATPAAGVGIRPLYNIAPRDDLVAVTNDAPEEMDLLQWGLLPSRADDSYDVPRPIDARLETVTEKPISCESFEERRCLILTDGSTSG